MILMMRVKTIRSEIREEAAEGKLDLLTVLDFRMSTTCLYGDIVLPTATSGMKR